MEGVETPPALRLQVGLHTDTPAQKEPAGQGRHDELENPPVEGLYVPATQAVGIADCGGQKLPAEQIVGVVTPEG